MQALVNQIPGEPIDVQRQYLAPWTASEVHGLGKHRLWSIKRVEADGSGFGPQVAGRNEDFNQALPNIDLTVCSKVQGSHGIWGTCLLGFGNPTRVCM